MNLLLTPRIGMTCTFLITTPKTGRRALELQKKVTCIAKEAPIDSEETGCARRESRATFFIIGSELCIRPGCDERSFSPESRSTATPSYLPLSSLASQATFNCPCSNSRQLLER